MNASEFRSRLKYGGARTNLFDVQISFPDAGAADELIKFTASSASVPDFSVGNIPVPYFGRIVNFAGDRTYRPFEMQILLDEDWSIRSVFEKWQDRLNVVNHDTNQLQNINGLQVYADVLMTPRGKDGRAISTYTLKNAYPTDIGQIQYSWAQQNQIAYFTVSFTFDSLGTPSLTR